MRIHALPAALLAAEILGGILAMVYVRRRGPMIPALFQARYLAGAPIVWAIGMTHP